jgi:DNA-binding NtrC family response regulator
VQSIALDQLKGLRILIAEDESIIVTTIEDMLADLGCIPVGPVRTVGEAFDKIGRDLFDCAILNLDLQGERCDPIADALVALGTPFIFATGYDRAVMDTRFKGMPFLQKPFDFSQLSRSLLDAIVPKRAMD